MTAADAPTEKTGGRWALGRLPLLSACLGVGLVALALGVLLAGPALYRMGVASLDDATIGVETAALYAAVAGGVVLAAGAALGAVGHKTRATITAVVGLTAALIMGFNIYADQSLRAALPPIYDVQTDWTRPVAFSEDVLRTRAHENAVVLQDDRRLPASAGRWAGRSFAEAQAVAYDLKPLLVGVPPPETTVAVAEAAKRLGWNVMRSDPPDGELEATHYSRWYGLGADIAVRVTPQGKGSRIDVRSASRVGVGDLGGNSQRITTLLNDVAFALRGRGVEMPQPETRPNEPRSAAPM